MPKQFSSPPFLYRAAHKARSLPSGAALDMNPEYVRLLADDGFPYLDSIPNTGSLGGSFAGSGSVASAPYWLDHGPNGKAFMSSVYSDVLYFSGGVALTNFLHTGTPFTLAVVGRVVPMPTEDGRGAALYHLVGTRTTGGLAAGLSTHVNDQYASGIVKALTAFVGPNPFPLNYRVNDTFKFNEWCSLVIQFTGTFYNIYLNGDLVGSRTPESSFSSANSQNPLSMMGSYVDLARVVAWDSVQDPSEIHLALTSIYGSMPQEFGSLPVSPMMQHLGDNLTEADGEDVPVWYDTSGNGNHLVAGIGYEDKVPIAATVEGRRCTRYGHTGNNFLVGPFPSAPGSFDYITIGMIIRVDSVSDAGNNSWVFSGATSSTTYRTALVIPPGSSASWTALRTSGSASFVATTGPGTVELNKWLNLCILYATPKSTGGSRIRVGDNLEGIGRVSGVNFSGPTVGNYGSNNAVYQFFGKIAEMHVYSRNVFTDLDMYLRKRLAA